MLDLVLEVLGEEDAMASSQARLMRPCARISEGVAGRELGFEGAKRDCCREELTGSREAEEEA